MRSQRGHGPENQRPESVDSSWQEGGILVVRRHDDAKSPVGMEILRERQRQGYTRSAPGVGGVRNGVLLEFRHEGDTRIFDAP
jgi:hypothetical protein